MIYTVKTIIGRENVAMESIMNKARVKGMDIKAVVHPEELKGYLFVEGNLSDIQTVVREITHARGILRNPVPVSEIKRFLEPRKVEISINEGDIIEVIGGPFKGEKGKITRFDKTKEEVTIELLEVTVPIPVTVSARLVKLIKRKE